MRLPENRDQEVMRLYFDGAESYVVEHGAHHFFGDEVDSHVRRDTSFPLKAQAHLLEEIEMPKEVVEGNDPDASGLKHSADLEQVWVNLQRGEVNEHVMREHAIDGSIGKKGSGYV